MKKIILIMLLFLNINQVHALDLKENILQTKSFLAEVLNETVNILKNQIRPIEEELKEQTTDVESLNETAKNLKNRSKDPEIDSTLLSHGLKTISECNSDEELYWSGSYWSCRKLSAKADCIPNDGEYIDTDLGLCYQKGNFEEKYLGWSYCDNKLGERYSVKSCEFTNSKKASIKYSVKNSLCKQKIAEKEQACGPNGAKSTCKCESGYKYTYKNGKGLCKRSLNFWTESEMVVKFNEHNGILDWGVPGDNYWHGGRCTQYYRTLKFDGTAIKKMYLRRMEADDYLWVYVNGHLVYSLPLGSDFSKQHGSSFHTKDNRSHPCEICNTMKRNMNIDITKYIHEGRNRINMRVIVGGKGEGYTKFKIEFKDSILYNYPPVCDKH